MIIHVIIMTLFSIISNLLREVSAVYSLPLAHSYSLKNEYVSINHMLSHSIVYMCFTKSHVKSMTNIIFIEWKTILRILIILITPMMTIIISSIATSTFIDTFTVIILSSFRLITYCYHILLREWEWNKFNGTGFHFFAHNHTWIWSWQDIEILPLRVVIISYKLY